MEEFIENPHALEVDEIQSRSGVGEEGLSQNEVERRKEIFGPNKLPGGKRVSIFQLIIKQFKSAMVLLLVVAAIISWLVGQTVDMWVIIAAILINTIIGFVQEFRADLARLSLQNMIVNKAKVIREGDLMEIESHQIVPGDLIVLEEGDSIPADGRVVESKNLRTVEGALTGESLPVSKNTEPLSKDTHIAERVNMAWKGTFVAGGYAKVIVTGIGLKTAIGEISKSLGDIEVKRTNFMKKTDVLAKQMSIIAVISAALIFVTGYFIREFSMEEVLLTSIAALVAAIPEGLLAVITIVLAIGAKRMAGRKAIISEFTSTETLGAVSAILTDKTGTLTHNTLMVQKVFIPGEPVIEVTGSGWEPKGTFKLEEKEVDVQGNKVLADLLKTGAISNNSRVKKNEEKGVYELIGDPTEGALNILAKKGGVKPADFRSERLDDLPFDSELKLRATLLNDNGEHMLYVIGAPEKILEQSSSFHTGNGPSSLNEEKKEEIRQMIADWSGEALRVIALAYKKYPHDEIGENNFDDLVFNGIVGMIDPPRTDAKQAVEKCRQAGVRVIMVTGDHMNTAVAIARATGILNEDNSEDHKAMSESDLVSLSDEEFDEALKRASVFARLTPKMKLKIADRMQAMGHLIAMTGDGVNDAPALKKADVGVAMGISGTDVSRDAADVVLADDNFATIVSAIEEGRIVFINARQTSFFLITTNIAESITLIVSIAIGFPIPLTATQILWLNLVTDGVTDIALATEKGHDDLMDMPPLKKNEKILNKQILPFLLINVLLMSGLTLAVFHYFNEQGLDKARTSAFIVMALTQLFNVFNLRSINRSVFAIGFFSNMYINIGVGASLLLLFAVTEIPSFASIFHFDALSWLEFSILFVLSSTVLLAGEIYKWVKKSGNQKS